MTMHDPDANVTMKRGTDRDAVLPADLVIGRARGRVFATAASVPGLYVSGETEEAVKNGVPDAVKALELFRADWFEQVRV